MEGLKSTGIPRLVLSIAPFDPIWHTVILCASWKPIIYIFIFTDSAL